MDKETLKYILAQSTTRPLPPATPRTLELPLESGKIVALVGVRRTARPTCSITALEKAAARFPRAKRVLVAHDVGSRKPPSGVQVTDAWRYLLGSPTPRA